MRTPRTELNLTEWVVLALASEAPTHGWTIVRALRRDGSLGEVWSSSGPLVYRAVARLQDVGLLQIVGFAEGQGPNRVILEATPAGSEQVREWLVQPVDHVRDMRTAFLIKLLLLERRGADRSLLVQRQRERLQPLAAALAERAEGAAGPDRLVTAWRALGADAVMQFLDAVDSDRPPERPNPRARANPA
jgi:PadR family transcriptional regulator AphA